MENKAISEGSQQQLRFQELVEECSSLLAGMDTLKLNILIEQFSAEIDSSQTLNYLVNGPSLLTCLITRHVVRPDNLSALVAVADMAERSDLKHSIDHYHSSSFLSHPEGPSVIDDVFARVASSIDRDWRHLARQLFIPEKDILEIHASTCDQQKAATEMLNLFRRNNSNRDLSRELVAALRAIRRFSLAAKIDDLLKTRLELVRDLL